MNNVREQLILAKKQLVQCLEENEKAYWANMKAWFKHHISKEEFDTEARRLLPKGKAHLHNQFLLSVLTKCHISGSSSSTKDVGSSQTPSKAKKTKRLQAIKRKFDHRFNVNMPSTSIPPVVNTSQDKARLPSVSMQPIKMCSKSLLIPSVEEMNSFVSIISWEMGLDDATDDAVKLATEAVRVFLKNLLSAIFSRRSAYRVYNKKFKYSMGCEPENPYVSKKKVSFLNSARPTYDIMESEEIEQIGKESLYTNSDKRPVSMYDLLHTLKIFQSTVIPSRTVYTFAVERILSNLWHPDNEELRQDKIMSNLVNCT